MLDLPQDYLTMIRHILLEQAPNLTVWAYGSRVTGKAHSGSDLDLVAIDHKHPEQPIKNLVNLRGAFQDSNLPISVDIVDWAAIPAEFRNEIKQAYFVMQESS